MVFKDPKVSIIIPAYNQAKFLKQSINSALAQNFIEAEVIVVDDGSTDETREIISQYGKEVHYIRQENRGLGGARNTGIQAARGDYVGLLDADDIWLPEFLVTMMSYADSQPDSAVLYCFAQGMDAEGKELPQIFGGPVRSPEKIYQSLIRANFIIPSTMVIKRSTLISNGLFEQNNRDIHGCEDWDLWLRILSHSPESKFIGVPKCMVRYRLHGNSLSDKPEKMQNAVRAVIRKNFGDENGDIESWSEDKKKAYGGVYRYNLLSSIQRQNKWDRADEYIQKALSVDATISEDLALFYDLALGNQMPGYRGSQDGLSLETNSRNIDRVLKNAFSNSNSHAIIEYRKRTFGTAYMALGLVAYNAGKMRLCRQSLLKALYYHPRLVENSLLVGDLLKSFLGRRIINMVNHRHSSARQST